MTTRQSTDVKSGRGRGNQDTGKKLLGGKVDPKGTTPLSANARVGHVPAKSLAGKSIFWRLLIAAAALETLYLMLFVLAPLPALHLYSTPLEQVWPQTLAPFHLLFTRSSPASGSLEGEIWFALMLLSLALLLLAAVYGYAVSMAARRRQHSNDTDNSNKSESTRWLLLLLGASALFCLTLLFLPRLFSDDVFSYIFSGRILTFYHADPLNTAPAQFLQDPYLRWVVSGRNAPNIFGPLVLFIASALVVVGHGPAMTLLLFKGVAVLSHLFNCLLLWSILSRVAPTRRFLGALLYAWNPLAILELAGNGHFDGLLLSLLLIAVWLFVQSKSRWREIGVLAMLGLAISMNLIALLIAPLYAWFVVRRESSLFRAMWGFCWRTLLGQGIVCLIYLPFWRGASTFFAYTSAIDMQHFLHSPVGLLIGLFQWIFGLVAQWSHFPPVMQPTTAADVTLRASSIFIFALIYLRLFGNARAAATTFEDIAADANEDAEMRLPGFDTLLSGWSSAVLWYLVLVLGWFWPWYVLWALWIVALRRWDVHTQAVLLLSGTALLSYPLLALNNDALAMLQPVLIYGPPLVYLFMRRKTKPARKSA